VSQADFLDLEGEVTSEIPPGASQADLVRRQGADLLEVRTQLGRLLGPRLAVCGCVLRANGSVEEIFSAPELPAQP